MDGAGGPERPNDLLDAYLSRRDDLVRFFAARLRSMTAAEDLVQDLYVRVASLEGGEPVENPSAYLYRLASNLMLDRLRSDRRSGAREDAWSQSQRLEMGGEAVADEPSAEQNVAARQRMAKLARAVAELPPKTRRAFELHKLEGLTQEETARALGVSRKTVEKQISAALQRLLAKLNEDSS
ncbi:MAG TPA: sigma-70 family RNA polymerase sigma factor [Caulobacteraceae bacterium]|jgi:RNA polymerase sigma-70 factor (ECF subfamily)